MKLLVTGGAGYIGSIVSRQLLERGHEVVVLDNLERGHREAVAAGARFVEADLRVQAQVATAVGEGFDGVLHFAALALVGESVSHPERYYRTNVTGTLNLLEAMRDASVPRLVFSSTCAVYGQPDEVPIREDAPPRPANSYGASKLAVDGMIGDFCLAHRLGAVSLRYFNVAGAVGRFGERHPDETHLVPLALRAAAGRAEALTVFGDDYPTPDGTCVRDFVHVDDLARAHLLALEAAEPGEHQVYNLGNGAGFSVLDVVEAVRSVTGRDLPVRTAGRRPGDPAVLVASSERIRDQLGWQPRHTGIDGIVADAWRFALEHGMGEP
jgi:UDP-glucose 4-epimerase